MSDILIAKQFTPLYDEKEDRLRVIININYPDRYDFWITRKFLIDIMDNLQNYLMRFQEEKVKENHKPTSNPDELPIYEPTSEASLLEKLNITKNDNIFILTMQSQDKTIQTTLTLQDLKNLLNAIIKPVRIQWGLGF